MRKVDPSKYDEEYFRKNNATLEEYEQSRIQIYDNILDLLVLKKNHKVVDFGCGTGLLSFLISKKYKCEKIYAIDYSENAIKLAKIYANNFYNNIEFIHSDIQNLNNMSGIYAIFLSDVVEHLYEEEISLFFQKILKWKRPPEYLVIHTDNDLYLRFVRPFLDLLSILSKNITYGELQKRNRMDDERHVNLTNLRKLSKKIYKYGGYKLDRINYPIINDDERLRNQLGFIGKFSSINYLIKKIYFLAKYFSPSFYALYKYENNKSQY